MDPFRGQRYMKGHGLGSIFAGLFRRALPFMKEGGKYLAKQALRTGTNTVYDILQGEAPKQALKRRVNEAKTKIIKDTKQKVKDTIMRKMKGGGIVIKKKNKKIKKKRVLNKSKHRTNQNKKRRKRMSKNSPKAKRSKNDLF